MATEIIEHPRISAGARAFRRYRHRRARSQRSGEDSGGSPETGARRRSLASELGVSTMTGYLLDAADPDPDPDSEPEPALRKDRGLGPAGGVSENESDAAVEHGLAGLFRKDSDEVGGYRGEYGREKSGSWSRPRLEGEPGLGLGSQATRREGGSPGRSRGGGAVETVLLEPVPVPVVEFERDRASRRAGRGSTPTTSKPQRRPLWDTPPPPPQHLPLHPQQQQHQHEPRATMQSSTQHAPGAPPRAPLYQKRFLSRDTQHQHQHAALFDHGAPRTDDTATVRPSSSEFLANIGLRRPLAAATGANNGANNHSTGDDLKTTGAARYAAPAAARPFLSSRRAAPTQPQKQQDATRSESGYVSAGASAGAGRYGSLLRPARRFPTAPPRQQQTQQTQQESIHDSRAPDFLRRMSTKTAEEGVRRPQTQGGILDSNINYDHNNDFGNGDYAVPLLQAGGLPSPSPSPTVRRGSSGARDAQTPVPQRVGSGGGPFAERRTSSAGAGPARPSDLEDVFRTVDGGRHKQESWAAGPDDVNTGNGARQAHHVRRRSAPLSFGTPAGAGAFDRDEVRRSLAGVDQPTGGSSSSAIADEEIGGDQLTDYEDAKWMKKEFRQLEKIMNSLEDRMALVRRQIPDKCRTESVPAESSHAQFVNALAPVPLGELKDMMIQRKASPSVSAGSASGAALDGATVKTEPVASSSAGSTSKTKDPRLRKQSQQQQQQQLQQQRLQQRIAKLEQKYGSSQTRPLAPLSASIAQSPPQSVASSVGKAAAKACVGFIGLVLLVRVYLSLVEYTAITQVPY